MVASVVGLYLHRETAGPMVPVEMVEAEAGSGLLGDTYHDHARPDRGERGSDREVTLIEQEAIDFVRDDREIPFEARESRRNIVTSGVALNDLVGREFSVGAVRLRGIRPCHPCAHLERLTRPGILAALVNRGGLRAQIREGGTIRVGDPVVVG